jgi:hypothetical protein
MRALRRPTMDGPDRRTDLVYSPIRASPSCNALSSSSVGRCRREERGSCRNTIKPIAQVWTSWPPNKIRISRLQAQSRGKCDLRPCLAGHINDPVAGGRLGATIAAEAERPASAGDSA